MTRPNPYLTTRIMTASPEQLRLMLYDGALRFCNQARSALEKQDYEMSYDVLVRAQKIVLELSASLKHDQMPELCGKLASLYTYIYRKLVDANTMHDLDSLDEAVKHLQYDRQTWIMLMDELKEQGLSRKPLPPAANPYADTYKAA